MGFVGDLIKFALPETDAYFLGLGLGSQELIVITATVAYAVQGLGVKAQCWDYYYIEFEVGDLPGVVGLLGSVDFDVWMFGSQGRNEAGNIDFVEPGDRLKTMKGRDI